MCVTKAAARYGAVLLVLVPAAVAPLRALAQWPSPTPAPNAEPSQEGPARAEQPAPAPAPPPTGGRGPETAQSEPASTSTQPATLAPLLQAESGGAPSAAATAGVAEGQVPPVGVESEEEAEKPWLPWMAAFSWSQGYTAAGFFKRSNQTHNPTYAWSFLLTAGYNFDKDTALSANQYSVIELTDSETTNTRQELVLYDTTLDLSHKFVTYHVDPDQDLALTGGGGLVLPTSKTSRAASLILGTRARVAATYSWKRVLHGLDVGPSFSYQRRWNGSNTVAAAGPFPCALTGRGASQDCGYLGSLSTSRDVFLLGLDGNVQLTEHWVAGVSLTFWWVLARGFDPVTESTSSGPVVVGDMSTTHSRNSRWLLFSLGYKITDWFTATARVNNIFSERGMAGQLRGPLNPLDTVVGLELAVSFDQLYLSTRAHGRIER